MSVHDEATPAAGAPWSRRQLVTTDAGTPVTTESGYRVVAVNTESSREIRDLASLRRDLELASAYATEFASIDRAELTGARDPRLALWSAAVVQYGRAFNGGVRQTRLDASDLDDVLAEAHQYFLDLRNKHVAHAVNDYEQTIVVAYLTDSSFAPRAITQTGQVHVELLACDEGDPELLVRLADHFAKSVNRRLKVLHDALGRELHELGEAVVYALPALEVPNPDRARVQTRRK